jgi:hypothetical protein
MGTCSKVDPGPAESLFSNLENEPIHHCDFPTGEILITASLN